jgi:hypothetical protein
LEITGKITGVIRYEARLLKRLEERELRSFDINDAPSYCVVKDGFYRFGVSKWVSPKRTRSYPYERVYNTLGCSKKITIIPIVKDEGKNGDRDFIQWDTILLMSLLDVYVILAHYSQASVKERKITDQKFDNNYVVSKIKEIEKCHSSALHWNLKEIDSLATLIQEAKNSCKKIEKQIGIILHNVKGLDDFQAKITKEVSTFKEFSRLKAAQAQKREFATSQPKESLATITKAKITIGNYLGGLYYFTVDETRIEKDALFLIESKHSRNAILPSQADIKDGLLKMILYSNLSDVTANDKALNCVAVLNLTSQKLAGNISSVSSDTDFDAYAKSVKLLPNAKKLIAALFEEARKNRFIVNIGGVK